MVSREVKKYPVGDKFLYHFEDHGTAILPWAEMVESLGSPPLLLTLDHHTDTNSAWLRSLFTQVGRDLDLMESLRKERISKIKINDQESLSSAIGDLHHDEHIDLALRLGLFSEVVVIQHSSAEPLPEWEQRGMTVLPFEKNLLENDSQKRSFYNRALEDDWLGPLLNPLPAHLNPWKTPYVLDIDLDYFKTKKSLHPENSGLFQRLIQGAIGITVAEEAGWVDRLWMDTPPQAGELYKSILSRVQLD
jgi:hypothetical protein